jgi:hypothetical protein
MPSDHRSAEHVGGAWPAWIRSPAMRRVGFVAGVLMLGLACAVLVRQRTVVDQAWHAVNNRPWRELLGLGGLVFASVLANIVLSALLFSILIRRYGRVGRMEMQALIALATLLNYVPLRPGFFGRLAYHRTVNAIPLRHSALTVIQAIALSAAVVTYSGLAAIASAGLGMSIGLLVIAPLPLLVFGSLVPGRASGANAGLQQTVLAGLFIRYLEVLVISLRYHAVFAVIGSAIDWPTSLAFACVSMLASMVPLLSNGLGLREWGIGFLAPLLTPYHLALGITADLIIRAAEMLSVLLAGLAGAWYLHRLRSRSTPANPGA